MRDGRMPALFLGHGSPMNVLEENRYTRVWQQLGRDLPRPRAILAISAHWYTRGTRVTAMEQPRTIHDFGGFPQALFDVRYPAPGSPALAQRVTELLPLTEKDESWGFDYGSWGLLARMYPEADIPLVQLSVDSTRSAEWHFEAGRKLAALRDEGILLVASGNVVHNLRKLQWQGAAPVYPWADGFNQYVRDNLRSDAAAGDHPLVNYQQHPGAALSHPTAEHYLPLLYILGARAAGEAVSVPVEGMEMGAISMLSAQVG
ncbi:4,5-DOPA dioxygenase extradiol [Pantoea sp. UBA4549]|uniref:4,5-DOPA-extradiol-dioxygenase n=1 Tax=Pantoea sp. UBA4549 TaxID=1947033 RepID=UPI0025DA7046|nr:4,5-DOPA dioxygenase extradiol [Pantoea sp. UBA4549]